MLSFTRLTGRHYATCIHVRIQKIIHKFAMSDKVIASTTDNGSNFKAAFSTSRLFGLRIYFFSCIKLVCQESFTFVL